VLRDIAVPTGRRPRSRPDVVVADKAYSHPSTRDVLRRMGISAVIPQRIDQIELRARRGRRGGRPPGFDPAAYRGRNVVERAFARLKSWRAIATRYDKHARNYRAGLVLAAIVLFWL
jgi:transposase